MTDPLGEITIGGVTIPLTLQLLVVASWAFLIDAPHIWATLGRTLFDPDEWRVRRGDILFSFWWFVIPPAIILLPYLIGYLTSFFGVYLPTGSFAMGAVFFFVFFRLWAYYHVVRQHWGFFNLYKRKANDYQHDSIDYWFFQLSFYLPMVLFMTSPYYLQTGSPDLGIHTPILSGLSVASMLYPVLYIGFFVVCGAYTISQFNLWRKGETLNANKLIYMALLIPLHFLAFSHPVVFLFVTPLVTVGHNIQYHCIVYSYAENKYKKNADEKYRWARVVFKNVAVYFLIGLLFTFALYRGPWITYLKELTGFKLDSMLFNAMGMMAGIIHPEKLKLGEQLFAGVIVGFALQHYYLDSKIWRVSKDKDVQKNLKV